MVLRPLVTVVMNRAPDPSGWPATARRRARSCRPRRGTRRTPERTAACRCRGPRRRAAARPSAPASPGRRPSEMVTALRGTGAPAGTGPIVPSTANSHTLSPRAEPSSAAPAEYASTYCFPLCSKVATGACMPAPVWNSHNCLPLAESSAVRRPSLRPTNSSPPAVASRAAVALLGPLIAPRERVGGDVDRGDDAGAGHARERGGAAQERVAVHGRGERRVAAAGIAVDHGRRAHEQPLLHGVVGARRPARAAPDAGRHDDGVLADEGREDAAVVHERVPLGRQLDELRHDGVAARKRLRLRGGLPRLLRHRLLVDADERLAGLAIEDVGPPGLAHLDDRLAHAAAHAHVHQHDGIDGVVVPDVVVHLLEVPAVLAGAEPRWPASTRRRGCRRHGSAPL